MMAMLHFKTDFLISAGQFTFISSWNHQECNSRGGGGGGGGGWKSYVQATRRVYKGLVMSTH